jgi:NAD(P)-dependent dehydrogenase (short-subunit alcohol dehydrogenase family)
MTLVREQFETNFFGPINIIKAALPVMRERKSGHIINLTGISELLEDCSTSANVTQQATLELQD